jgi:hypothetical protein
MDADLYSLPFAEYHLFGGTRARQGLVGFDRKQA